MPDDHVERVSYRPGTGTALVAGSSLVLLGPEVSRAAATELWPALDTATSLEELVDVVLEIGLRNLPTIAIAFRAPDEIHVLLRGKAKGAVSPFNDNPEQLLGSDAKTWREHTVSGPVRLYLADCREGDDLPLTSGVVPADALSVEWSVLLDDLIAAPDDRSATDLGSPPGSRVDDEPEPEPEPDVGPEVESGGEHDADSANEYSDVTLTESGLEELSVNGPLPADHATSSDLVPEPPPLTSVSMDHDEVDSFDDLFGATRLPLPVEHAAVRAEEMEDDEVAGGSGPVPRDVPSVATSPDVDQHDPSAEGLGYDGFLPPKARAPSVSAVAPPAAEPGRLIDGVPGVGHVSTAASREAPDRSPGVSNAPTTSGALDAPVRSVTAFGESDEGDDLSSMTVSRASLGKRKGATAPSVPPLGQTVHGVWCDAGHPNPAAATRCRSCSLPLEQVDAVSMPRPVLGVLRFSNGIEVELDRPVIVGRAPKAERVSAREIPQLISVPSPDKDISRSHLEVKLDGWHVIVVDLGSTNGTVVTLPGQPPERLRASEEQPISPGTVVTIAEEITFVYEVPV